jgi:hypothetical protein
MSKSKLLKIMVVAASAFAISALFLPVWAQSAAPPDQQHADSNSAAQTPPAQAIEKHEDWTSPRLKPGALTAAEPLIGERDDVSETGFIRERYQMLWRNEDPLDVFVVLPRNVERPPVIIYLYSFPQDTDRFKDDRWCESVTSNGYAAVGFVSRLTGHRVHDRPVKEWFVSELQESLADSAHDVQMILNYLDTRSDLDTRRIGMFGVGSGASVAILAAAVDPRIKAINLIGPWGDWPDWLAKSSIIPNNERATYLTPEFLAKVAPLDPMVWLPRIKTAQVRIQNVRNSPIVPDDVQKKIESAAPPYAVVDQFENGRAFVPVSAGGKVFDWIRDQLQLVPVPALASYSPGVHFYPASESVSLPPLSTAK